MREELSTEHEYELFDATSQEIITLHSYLEQYISSEYQKIVAEKETASGIVQGVVYRLGRSCAYLWYLGNYTADIANPNPVPGRTEKPDGYLLEAEFEDLDLLGKVIAIYDTDKKLVGLLKINKLRYFYENYTAASGKKPN